MLPSGSLSVISFGVIIGDILVVACFDRCTFAPESAIVSVSLLV